ncbi:MAG: hypothetical protein HY047_15935 [Acidobacteria bacterium]|nr:hypothetical protein [Acidobacteriota bacterium]
MTVAELSQIHDRELADLARRDAPLFEAVHQCMWDQMMADDGITLREWQRRAVRRAERVNAIRRTLSPEIRLADLQYVRSPKGRG